MESSKKYKLINLQVLLFLAVYLFVALSYVYFLPNYSNGPVEKPAAVNSIFKRQIQYQGSHNINYFQRTDKTTLNEKRRDILLALQATSIAFFMVFLGLDLLASAQKISPLPIRLFYNRQYAYIPLCTFRI